MPDMLTVIVPVLDEADRLPGLAAHLNALPCDVVVVDGGSGDGTRERLADALHPGIRVMQSGAGRARQMNAGAWTATSPALLFLHADTELPASGVQLATGALADGAGWGRFDVRFDHATPLMRAVAWSMNQRSALTGICTGDQAMFVRTDLFRQVGGFPDIPLMEDIELSRKLKKLARPVRIRRPVVTAARRWQSNGTVRTILEMWWLRLRFWLGASPESLAERYKHAR